jgi:rhomboid protease GluP
MRTSVVTIILIAINLVAYAAVAMKSGDFMRPGGSDLVVFGANFAPLTIGHLEIWRLLTSMFLHGSLMHLAINMYSLYSVGTMVEFLCGRKKYLEVSKKLIPIWTLEPPAVSGVKPVFDVTK